MLSMRIIHQQQNEYMYYIVQKASYAISREKEVKALDRPMNQAGLPPVSS